MPLVRMTEPWDDPDWIFELKYDGFRSLAFVGSNGVRLVSREQFVYRRYGDFALLSGPL
jgi:bifunctional non-homologous end joining protein LigD